MTNWRDLVAAGVALGLPFFAVSDGNAGHPLLQTGLILAGALLIFEVAVELLEALR